MDEVLGLFLRVEGTEDEGGAVEVEEVVVGDVQGGEVAAFGARGGGVG